MHKRMINLLVFIGALTAAAIFTIAQAGKPAFVIPPAKQTIGAYETKVEATRAVVAAHITKIPDTRPIVEPASCPQPTEHTGIRSFLNLNNPVINLPFSGRARLTSEALAKSSAGNYYWMWAGAPEDEWGKPTPQSRRGLIRVIVFFPDPCVSHGRGTQEPPLTDYLAPKGPLTFTKIEDDTILYSIEGGGSGRFNFVTGQFLP